MAPTCLGCYVNPTWQHSYPPQPYEEPHFTIVDLTTPKEVSFCVSLTEDEKEVLNHLVQAWNKFIALPNQSEHNLREYQTAIHQCQQLIALRVARRADPDVWKQPE
jgi:hypothetical protein